VISLRGEFVAGRLGLIMFGESVGRIELIADADFFTMGQRGAGKDFTQHSDPIIQNSSEKPSNLSQ
jgi:hypothetical protein